MDAFVRQETIDHGQVAHAQAAVIQAALLAIVELLSERPREETVRRASAELFELERIDATSRAELAARSLDVYQQSRDQRYQTSLIKRVLTLGLSGSRDADNAAQGAREEVTSLLEDMRGVQSVALQESVDRRVRLLEQAGDSGLTKLLNEVRERLPRHASTLERLLGHAGRARVVDGERVDRT